MQIGIDSRYITRSSAMNALATALLAVLMGCGGGGGGDSAATPTPTPIPTPTPTPTPTPAVTYSISGTITGLTGSGLVLASGTSSLPISAAGPQTYATSLATGTSYNVTVTTQPTSPSQTCTVTNGSGTVAAANITNVAVSCVTNTYMVGVTVSGLASATSVVLQNNAANDVTASTNAATNFTAAIASGASYAVTVKTQPVNPIQICTVMNGSGMVAAANINVAVACVTTPLTVTNFTPANNATNVSRTVSPALSFSAALNAATFIPSNITLTSSASTVSVVSAITAGSTASALNVVTASKLLPAAQYTLTVTGGIRGQYGEALANAVTSQFTTADGVWGNAGLIETDNVGFAVSPQIAFDANGNALAVWFQTDNARYNIWANRYTVGAGWGTAVMIETDNAGDAYSPQIAFDASGNALAVWQQSDGIRADIWSNRYVVGSGWGSAVQIETGTAATASPQLAVDSSGNALAIWSQSDGIRYNIWSNRYTAGGGWGTATLIESDNSGHANKPQIAVDTNGNALAVWYQSDGSRNNIVSNRYTAGVGWGTAVLIETDNVSSAETPQIAFDASGNALAVWSQYDSTRNNVWSNRYFAGSGWSTAALIETDNASDAEQPQIVIDAGGNALAVWSQSDGTRNNIVSTRFE